MDTSPSLWTDTGPLNHFLGRSHLFCVTRGVLSRLHVSKNPQMKGLGWISRTSILLEIIRDDVSQIDDQSADISRYRSKPRHRHRRFDLVHDLLHMQYTIVLGDPMWKLSPPAVTQTLHLVDVHCESIMWKA